jgi:hypothetical protein
MFDEQDRAYFARRAKDAREKADAAIDPAVKRVHQELAEEYERRAHGYEPKVIHRIPTGT